MKTTIYYLSISLLAFANYASAANHVAISSKSSSNIAVSIPAAIVQDLFSEAITATENKKSGPDDEVIMNPESVISVNSRKTIEEIIADNNKIIESDIPNQTTFLYIEMPIEEVIAQNNLIIEDADATQLHPLYLEKTIEDNIAEDNKIIESDLPAESYPLELVSKR